MISAIRVLYNIIYPVAALIMLPGLIWKMIRRGKYRHKFGQRFAIYSGRVRSRLATGDWTWIHAVSVGEVLIAMKLIDHLRKSDPKIQFVLSTTTSTGFALASQRKSDWLEPIYNPLDFLPFARSAMALIRPRNLILIEAEVWPNLVSEAKRRGAKVVLANARLSPRSERRFRAARWITGPVFNLLDVICVPDNEDVARWTSLGVRANRLRVTGSIKFDDLGETPASASPTVDFSPFLRNLGVGDDAIIFLGASTHPGEERILAQIVADLRRHDPRWFFLSVPRHVERAAEVFADLEAAGLNPVRRTQLTDAPVDPGCASLLVDTTGELRDWTRCATMVFVGKSLRSKGGQNPTEAIAAGRPVIFGPHMQNFAILARDLIHNHGAIQIATADELPSILSTLASDPHQRATLVSNGQAVLAKHRGATDRTCQLIRSLL